MTRQTTSNASETWLRGALCAGGLLLLATAAHAEEGAGVAASGMGQGEAAINVRSDIKLGVKGTRGTSQANLEQLTDVLADQMPKLRQCYRELMEKRPDLVGSLAIRVTLETDSKTPQLEMKEIGPSAPPLTKCVEGVLAKASFAKVARPAAAIATLELSNSRAAGQATMLEHRAAADAVPVREEGGGFVAEWVTSGNEVAFIARSERSRDAVEAVVKSLRQRFAGFLDCRRRARKGELSPAGEIQLSLKLARGGDASVKVGASTVAHERAAICVERAMSRVVFENAPPGQKVDVTVRFTP
jgi:hypothetical protein